MVVYEAEADLRFDTPLFGQRLQYLQRRAVVVIVVSGEPVLERSSDSRLAKPDAGEQKQQSDARKPSHSVVLLILRSIPGKAVTAETVETFERTTSGA
jgi:hypothetical protein